MKTTIRIVATIFCVLPWAAQAQEARPAFYQQDRLYEVGPHQKLTLLGQQVAARPGRLATTSTVVLYPQDIDARLTVPAGSVFFQGLQSPHQPEWAYLERAEIGNAYNLWLYNTATGNKQLLFTQQDSPVPGYALKPIAWSADRHVLYLEALKFDTDFEHEGVWSFDLRTRQVQRLALASKYFSTPLLSPGRHQFLYTVSTAAKRDLLHGFADEVALYDLAARTETVVAQQKGVPHTVAGWAAAPLTAADTEAATGPATTTTAARISAINYRLPWDAGREYYVSRHGTPAPSGPHTPSGSRTTIYDGIGQHGYAAIDFDTPDNADQNVRASAPGTVTVASDCGCGYGNLVVVSHADGTRSYYGHNKSFRVAVGQAVQAGTILAIEGTTGVSSGDHIHFEWRAAGGNVPTMGTFSDVGQPRQGWKYLSTTPDGTTPPPTDTQAPTTSITGPSSASASFTTTFTDADNVGVTNRFYQPLEWRTDEWRANRGNGFYNDNFGNSALHPDYVAGLDDWQGTWAETTAGTLRQTNTTATNTAISTFVSQTAGGNAYLYNFAAKVNSTSGTRRFGIHIMASSNTLRERGDSYLVWFSLDQQTVSIIETIGNVLNSRVSVPLALGSGTFADYKVLYNTSTGTIQAFQNDNLVASWTDTTPLTSGANISLRTGTADVEFDDLKVYKSRGTSATITVGSANTNDVRTSGTPGAKIKSLVKDAAHNWSTPGNLDVNISIPVARLATAEVLSAYPNPLTVVDGKLTIAYALAAAGNVRVVLYDAQGTALKSWVSQEQAGAHELAVPARELGRAGIYFVRVAAGGKSQLIRVQKD